MSRRLTAGAAVAAGALLLLLLLPAAAGAHVSVHPNVIPEGTFTKLAFRIPNEEDSALTTSVAIQMPKGVISVSAAPPPGWKFSEKTTKLATPVKTDDGTIDTQVTEIEFTGGKLPPGQFVELPVTMTVPGKAGDVATFKVVQRYSDGTAVRWIGPPDADQPAPTVDVSAAGGVIEDVAGGEAGPPPTAGRSDAPATLDRGGDAGDRELPGRRGQQLERPRDRGADRRRRRRAARDRRAGEPAPEHAGHLTDQERAVRSA